MNSVGQKEPTCPVCGAVRVHGQLVPKRDLLQGVLTEYLTGQAAAGLMAMQMGAMFVRAFCAAAPNGCQVPAKNSISARLAAVKMFQYRLPDPRILMACPLTGVLRLEGLITAYRAGSPLEDCPPQVLQTSPISRWRGASTLVPWRLAGADERWVWEPMAQWERYRSENALTLA